MNKAKNNLTPKFLSIAIAILLWSYVMGIKNPDWPREYKNVNVTFTNVEDLDRQNLRVMEPDEVKINVSVTGKKSDMADFTAANNIVAKLDLRGYGEGQIKVPVTVSLKNSASTVRVTKYEPTEILVNIDKIVTEEKTVNIRIDGGVSDDYTVGDIESKPQTVLLRGPRSWVNKVSDVFVIVNMNDRVSTSNITLPVQIKDQHNNDVVGLEKIPSVVDIGIPIYRKATLPIDVVLENELPEGYVVTEMNITPGEVTIKGGSNVSDLNSIKTKPVDINKLLDNSNLDVELDLLEDIELIDPSQRVTINAKIEKIGMKELEFDISEIEFRNLDANLSIGESLGTVKFVIRGTESILDSITKDTLKPYVDLSGLSEGEFDLDVNVGTVVGATIESNRIRVILGRR